MDNLFNLVQAFTVSHDVMCGLPVPEKSVEADNDNQAIEVE